MTRNQCPICEGLPRGPLCKAHRQELAKTIHELRLGMYELKRMERREVHHKPHGERTVRSVFSPTLIDMTAASLYDYAEEIIQDVAGDIGLWAGEALQLLTKLAGRMGRLANAPNSGRDYRDLTRINRKVQLHITPPEERIIHGHCLSPTCGAELSGLPDDTMSTCSKCGNAWVVAEVRRVRRERMEGQYIIGQPKVAAQWVCRETGLEIKRGDVSNWRRRGLLHPVETETRGVWQWAKPELLECAEGMRLAT